MIEEDGAGHPSNQERRSSGPADGVHLFPPAYAADNMQLRGDYGYSFSGSFGTGLAGQIVETGVLSADGNGNIKATAKAVINGTVEQDAMYGCTYEVGAALAIAFDCVRTANGAKADANFFGVLDDKRSELRFHALPSAPPFDIVNVAGSARKQ